MDVLKRPQAMVPLAVTSTTRTMAVPRATKSLPKTTPPGLIQHSHG
jgi:hypothetical protein